MIKRFTENETEKNFIRKFSRKLPPRGFNGMHVENPNFSMLPQSLKICGFHLEIDSKNWLAIGMDNTALESVDNGVFVLFGETALPAMLRSPIITGSNHDYGKT